MTTQNKEGREGERFKKEEWNKREMPTGQKVAYAKTGKPTSLKISAPEEGLN